MRLAGRPFSRFSKSVTFEIQVNSKLRAADRDNIGGLLLLAASAVRRIGDYFTPQ
jgi:hypothetical protein